MNSEKTSRTKVATAITIIILLLVAGVLLATANRDSQVNISHESEQQTDDNSSQKIANKQNYEIPNNWVEYTNSALNLSLMHPSEWSVTSCDSNSFVILTEGESLKCGTENQIEGPVFLFDTDATKSCNEVESNDIQSTDCYEELIGQNNILIEEYTFIKNGAFGEAVGDKYYEYNFIGGTLDNLVVSFRQNTGNSSIKPDVETIISSIMTTE